MRSEIGIPAPEARIDSVTLPISQYLLSDYLIHVAMSKGFFGLFDVRQQVIKLRTMRRRPVIFNLQQYTFSLDNLTDALLASHGRCLYGSSRWLLRWLAIPPLFVLAACMGSPMTDAHVPPFAKAPYEAFSRQSVVSIALREWRLFGQNVAYPEGEASRTVKPEREPGLWQRVGEYWWLGLNAGSTESAWTGMHDGRGQLFPPDCDGDYAWSAAFISYVLRIAGAGERFPYSADHADYINAARKVSLGQTQAWLVSAERVEDYAPRPGDLMCFGRGNARGLRYEDLPTAGLFTSHCDIVVDTQIPGRIGVIGGNVEDSVTLNTVPVTEDGKLATSDGVVLDPRFPWMAVLRLIDD